MDYWYFPKGSRKRITMWTLPYKIHWKKIVDTATIFHWQEGKMRMRNICSERYKTWSRHKRNVKMTSVFHTTNQENCQVNISLPFSFNKISFVFERKQFCTTVSYPERNKAKGEYKALDMKYRRRKVLF